MKKNTVILLTLSLLFIFGNAYSQGKLDLTGTWEGSTFAEGPGFDMVFTLVLKHEDDAITGKLTDDMGYIDSEITGAKLEGDVLTFEAIAMAPDGEIPMIFTLKCSSSELKGEWDAGGGEAYGEWTATKNP